MRRRLGMLLVALVLPGRFAALAGDLELRRFQMEYKQASVVIQERLQRVRGEGRLKRSFYTKPSDLNSKPKSTEEFFKFSRDQGFIKFELARTKERLNQEPTLVECYGEDDGFVLKLDPGTRSYTVERRGMDGRSRDLFYHLYGKFLEVPFSVTGLNSLAKWIDARSYAENTAESVVVGKRELIRVKLKWGPPSENSLVVDLDPRNGWVIQSAKMTLGDGGDLGFVAEYGGGEALWPMPTSVQYTNIDRSVVDCRFTRVEYEPTERGAFALSRYIRSAPEHTIAPRTSSGRPIQRRGNVWWYFGPGLGIAFLLLLIAKRIRRSGPSGGFESRFDSPHVTVRNDQHKEYRT